MVINTKGVGKNVRAGIAAFAASWLLFLACVPAGAREAANGAPIALASLPREAQHTEQLIRAGGPFPYSKDGVVFVLKIGHAATTVNTRCPARKRTTAVPGESSAAVNRRNQTTVFIPKITTAVFIAS